MHKQSTCTSWDLASASSTLCQLHVVEVDAPAVRQSRRGIHQTLHTCDAIPPPTFCVRCAPDNACGIIRANKYKAITQRFFGLVSSAYWQLPHLVARSSIHTKVVTVDATYDVRRVTSSHLKQLPSFCFQSTFRHAALPKQRHWPCLR